MTATARREVPANALDAQRVTPWLASSLGCEPPLDFALIGHGRSNLTVRVADAKGRVWVLRRPPLGERLPSAHDMEREHRILSALADAGAPVPRPLALCTDLEVTGEVFYVMEHVDGRVLSSAAAARELDVEVRRRGGESLMRTLASLHALDVDAIGLGSLGPRASYAGRQLRRWSGQWERSRTRDDERVGRIAARLEAIAPPQREVGLVHGDYRIDNVMIDDHGDVVAVLDWELCALGDPLADVGMLQAYTPRTEADVTPVDNGTFLVPGFPAPDELIELYARASGRSLDGLRFWTALGVLEDRDHPRGRLRPVAPGPRQRRREPRRPSPRRRPPARPRRGGRGLMDHDLRELQARTAEFIRSSVIPAEPRDHGGHGLDADLRAELQAAARAAGVFAPQVAPELGGLGLDMRGQAVVLEEAGYSLLGPQALNCAAPDEGNMHLLAVVADDRQRERYLRPLAAGQIRSCFAMSEPPPGAGSDPSMLRTAAEPVGGGWVLNGHKHFITGADDAAFAICMARTSETVERDEGATMFLVDADNPGWRVARVMDVIDRSFPGGHAEVVLEDCFVPSTAVLGEVGLGFRFAQVRLGPARLTHCMRWLGLARRALDVALDHVSTREAFGAKIGELGMAQALIADSVIDLETSRALIRQAAAELDAGGHARHETSVAKAHVAEAVYRVVDRSIQLCGAFGVASETQLGRYLAEVRPFRIYDGPTDTHRWAIARRALRRHARSVAAPDRLQ